MIDRLKENWDAIKDTLKENYDISKVSYDTWIVPMEIHNWQIQKVSPIY